MAWFWMGHADRDDCDKGGLETLCGFVSHVGVTNGETEAVQRRWRSLTPMNEITWAYVRYNRIARPEHSRCDNPAQLVGPRC